MIIKHILFPTDFSDQSFAALDYASHLAASFGAELHFLYVEDLRHLLALAPYSCPSFTAAADQTITEHRLKSLQATVAGVRCFHHFLEGVPADEICTFVEKEHIDLIVMSSHGRTGLSHLFIGSVAEEVLQRAKCPVFVVKHPMPSLPKPTGANGIVPACTGALPALEAVS